MTTTQKTRKQSVLDLYFNPKYSKAMEEANIGEKEKKVHLVLTELCGEENGRIDISSENIAKITGLSYEEVEQAIKILMEAGLIRK